MAELILKFCKTSSEPMAKICETRIEQTGSKKEKCQKMKILLFIAQLLAKKLSKKTN
jgi:hypothetical protein